MQKWMGFALIVLATASCSPKSSPNYFAPVENDRKVTDANSDVFDPKADILFVVDNSASMSGHQSNLARNIGLFTSVFLQSSVLDYQIGVITTDNGGFGSAADRCCGRLVGIQRIVTNTTPNAISHLQDNLLVGTSGSGYEKPFESTAAALSPAMLSGVNAGLVRASAALIVIFITDANDQSNVTPNALLNTLLNLKGGDKRQVLSYGAIIPRGVRGCSRDGTEPDLIEEFLDKVPNGVSGGGKGGNVVSLCDPNFGQKLADFALQIVDQVSSTIYLSRLPDPKSLRVSYGSADLPMDPRRGWMYNPERNVIQLGPDIDWTSQPVGSKIEVHYREARG